MTLFEATTNPGTGSSMRRALEVLAKEWRRRGQEPDRAYLSCGFTGPCPRCAELHTHLVQHMPPSLRALADGKTVACTPNPHPEGSYMWAYEETQRGRQVKRECGRCWPTDGLLEHDDFIATDWVLC
jgi:hypothetical protein